MPFMAPSVRSKSLEPAAHVRTITFVKVSLASRIEAEGVNTGFQPPPPTSWLAAPSSRRVLTPQQRPSPPTLAGESRLFAVIDWFPFHLWCVYRCRDSSSLPGPTGNIASPSSPHWSRVSNFYVNYGRCLLHSIFQARWHGSNFPPPVKKNFNQSDEWTLESERQSIEKKINKTKTLFLSCLSGCLLLKSCWK